MHSNGDGIAIATELEPFPQGRLVLAPGQPRIVCVNRRTKAMNSSRRAVLVGLLAFAAFGPQGSRSLAQSAGIRPKPAGIYGPIDDDLYPIPGINLSQINPVFLRSLVAY